MKNYVKINFRLYKNQIRIKLIIFVFISILVSLVIIKQIRKEDALICTVDFIGYCAQVYLIES